MIDKNKFFGFLALCFFCSVLINPIGLNAWNETGHKITATIAWQYLTLHAKDQIIDILNTAPKDSDILDLLDEEAPNNLEQYFMNASYWPDMVRDRSKPERNEKYHKGAWHYIGSYWKQTDKGPIETIGLIEEENVAERISYFRETLISHDTPLAVKAIQIAWVAHLIGDIHMPLHNASRMTAATPDGDLGGNAFALGNEWPNNLHAFWDGIIDVENPRDETHPKFDYYKERAEEITKRYPREYFGNLITQQDPNIWTKEGKQIVMESLYPETLAEGEKPSIEYQEMAFAIAQERLALSGYRMAEFLNGIFEQ